MVALLIALVVLGGLVAVIFIAARAVMKRDETADSGGAGVRRFFQYALLYGLLLIAATGVTGLLSGLFSQRARAGHLRGNL